MSPERLLTALQTEVIARRPDVFKTACLSDVRRLFPRECAPFYAGFGNRPTDAISYRAVGMPRHKIFIIDHHGDIRTDNKTYVKTYGTLNELVDAVFPPIEAQRESTEDDVEEHFNAFQYWRTPPKVDIKSLPPLK